MSVSLNTRSNIVNAYFSFILCTNGCGLFRFGALGKTQQHQGKHHWANRVHLPLTAPDYTKMQWVLDYYQDDTLVPERGYVSVSDYALLHKTRRNEGARSRVSIDTTIFAGEHDVHPDRRSEYLDSIPRIGETLFINCLVSETEPPREKKTLFTHYTGGSLQHIDLSNGAAERR